MTDPVLYEIMRVALDVATEIVKHSSCQGCAFYDREEWELPCSKCKRNCRDYWRKKGEQE